MTILPNTLFAQEDYLSVCGEIAGTAEVVMQSRQDGISMSKIMQVLDSNAEMDESTKKLMRDMLIAAYELPRFSTEKVKKETIENFRDQYYLGCVKGLRNE